MGTLQKNPFELWYILSFSTMASAMGFPVHSEYPGLKSYTIGVAIQDFSERAVEKVTEKNRCVTKLRPATKKLAKYEKALGASTATAVKLVAKKDELAPTLNIEQARLRKTREKEVALAKQYI